jgi:hypothetical protein
VLPEFFGQDVLRDDCRRALCSASQIVTSPVKAEAYVQLLLLCKAANPALNKVRKISTFAYRQGVTDRLYYVLNSQCSMEVSATQQEAGDVGARRGRIASGGDSLYL